jgi:hypothetical protein
MHFILILLAGLLAGGPALAQPKWAQGQTYSGNIDIGGVQVPLPPGDWEVLGSSSTSAKFDGLGHNTMADPGASVIVALGQFVSNRLRAYTVVNYNARAMSDGWTAGEEKQCRREFIHMARVFSDRQTAKSCSYVNHTVFVLNEKSTPWWRQSVEYIKQKNMALPDVTLLSGTVVSDRANFVAVAYHFSPQAAGFGRPKQRTWSQSDWNKENAAQDPKRQAYVRSVIDWTEKSRPVVEAGLAGKLKKGEGLDWPSAMQ